MSKRNTQEFTDLLPFNYMLNWESANHPALAVYSGNQHSRHTRSGLHEATGTGSAAKKLPGKRNQTLRVFPVTSHTPIRSETNRLLPFKIRCNSTVIRWLAGLLAGKYPLRRLVLALVRLQEDHCHGRQRRCAGFPSRQGVPRAAI